MISRLFHKGQGALRWLLQKIGYPCNQGPAPRPWGNWRQIVWDRDDVTITGTRDWLTMRTAAGVIRVREPFFAALEKSLSATIKSTPYGTPDTFSCDGVCYGLSRLTDDIVFQADVAVIKVDIHTCIELQHWLWLLCQPRLMPLLHLSESLHFDYDQGRICAIRIGRGGNYAVSTLHPNFAQAIIHLDPTRCRQIADELWQMVSGRKDEVELEFQHNALRVLAAPQNPVQFDRSLFNEQTSLVVLAHLAAVLECHATKEVSP